MALLTDMSGAGATHLFFYYSQGRPTRSTHTSETNLAPEYTYA